MVHAHRQSQKYSPCRSIQTCWTVLVRIGQTLCLCSDKKAGDFIPVACVCPVAFVYRVATSFCARNIVLWPRTHEELLGYFLQRPVGQA